MCCVGSTPTKYMLCFEQYLAGEDLILSTILLSAKTFKVQLDHTVYLWNHNLPLWEEKKLPFISAGDTDVTLKLAFSTRDLRV